jgi:hypothetical protein
MKFIAGAAAWPIRKHPATSASSALWYPAADAAALQLRHRRTTIPYFVPSRPSRVSRAACLMSVAQPLRAKRISRKATRAAQRGPHIRVHPSLERRGQAHDSLI